MATPTSIVTFLVMFLVMVLSRVSSARQVPTNGMPLISSRGFLVYLLPATGGMVKYARVSVTENSSLVMLTQKKAHKTQGTILVSEFIVAKRR